MARKLVSIQRIIDLQPISGADKIELATVLGWKVVVSKSENHKVGDLIAYVEIDTQLPNIPMFEFLKDKKYRVRTIKLRKQISQGLIIPLKAIEQNFNIKISKLKEGDDITSLIGATKYDPEAEKERKLAEEAMAKNNNPIHKILMKYKWYRKLYKQITIPKKGGFPKWIKKTDEIRLQVIPEEFYEIVNDPNATTLFNSTEKIDRSICYLLCRKT